MSIKLSDEIKSFAALMQKELDDNAHKGDWKEFNNVEKILSELEWHKAKLLLALKEGDTEKVREYLADCSNNLMFIAHTLKML